MFWKNLIFNALNDTKCIKNLIFSFKRNIKYFVNCVVIVQIEKISRALALRSQKINK